MTSRRCARKRLRSHAMRRSPSPSTLRPHLLHLYSFGFRNSFASNGRLDRQSLHILDGMNLVGLGKDGHPAIECWARIHQVFSGLRHPAHHPRVRFVDNQQAVNPIFEIRIGTLQLGHKPGHRRRRVCPKYQSASAKSKATVALTLPTTTTMYRNRSFNRSRNPN